MVTNVATGGAELTTEMEHKSSLFARVVSGSIGSFITSLVVTPLEVAKVRTQMHSPKPTVIQPCPKGCGTFVVFNGHLDCVLPESCFAKKSTAAGRTTRPLPGTLSLIRTIFAQEGFNGIYAGLRPTLVMAIPNTVLYFSAYEEILWRLRNSELSNDWAFPLVAGGSARLLASSVTAPFEFLRTRHAIEGKAGEGLISDFQTITRAEGIGALFKGLRPTLWRDVPFSAIYWYCLEKLRLQWKEHSTVPPTPLEQAGQAFVNGATAGVIAAACTTPFDVLKTRQQATITESIGADVAAPTMRCNHDGAVVCERPGKANGTFQLLHQIARTEGISGLWRGNQARMLKVAPSCAIMISSYELGKRLLEKE